jgi:hypothetical protein
MNRPGNVCSDGKMYRGVPIEAGHVTAAATTTHDQTPSRGVECGVEWLYTLTRHAECTTMQPCMIITLLEGTIEKLVERQGSHDRGDERGNNAYNTS